MNKIEAINNLRAFADEVSTYGRFTVGEGPIYRYFYKTAASMIDASSLAGDFSLETTGWTLDLKMVLSNGNALNLLRVFMDTFDLNGVHHLKIGVSGDLEKLKVTLDTYDLFKP